ncbi:SPP1 family predicted phage head-tail adaptor [Virgibacillus halotolerans]|uniref:phage head closure protein n=1 Tax=Virgibacillus halotolerans TaxID=1071053 RepID=UPI001960882C|nr:SPP1 family predicted phage head-tail adaptor [Virgibacillus halotolerans]
MKSINPAKYRNRISFQQEQDYQTDEGHWVTDLVDVADIGKVWAEIKSIRGNEFIIAGANAVDVSARITMRYNKHVTDDMKIKFGDRMYDITFINNLEERNIELEILASEVRTNE